MVDQDKIFPSFSDAARDRVNNPKSFHLSNPSPSSKIIMSSIVPTSGNRFIPADVLPSMELITAILKGDSNRLGSILQKLPLNDSTTTEPKIGGGSGGGGGHKRSKSQQVLDINFVTPDEKRTALHFSSSTGSVQCTELLLKQGNIHIDAQDFQGNSPLHLAVICEELDIVKILVKAGADVFLHNFRGTRPLDCAKNGDIQAFLTGEYSVRFLLHKNCPV